MLLRMIPIFEILLYRTGNQAMAPTHLCPQHTRLLSPIIFIISPALLLSLTNRNYNLWYFFNSSQSLLTFFAQMQATTICRLYPTTTELADLLPTPVSVTATVKITSRLTAPCADVQEMFPTWKVFSGEIQQFAAGQNQVITLLKIPYSLTSVSRMAWQNYRLRTGTILIMTRMTS